MLKILLEYQILVISWTRAIAEVLYKGKSPTRAPVVTNVGNGNGDNILQWSELSRKQYNLLIYLR